MASFTAYQQGTPCWVDLTSSDVDASKSFYSAVFGWETFDQLDDDGNRIYVNFRKGDDELAGLGSIPPGMEGMPSVWNTYIAVDDCDAIAAKVAEAGGSVMMPPMQVMEAGKMAVFADKAGAVFSVWQAGDHIGATLVNEPDTYSWNELISRDVPGAKEFYGQVFGWTFDVQDMGPMGEYNVIEGGDNGGLGGMMTMPAELPDQVPNHWMAYFWSADIASTIAKVNQAGGQVVNGPFAAPGVGQIAVVHDPQGAVFSVLEPEAT